VSAYAPLPLAKQADIAKEPVALAELPRPLVVREHLGIVTHSGVDGRVVYRAEGGTLFETRATRTPGGDYLLMFPTNPPGKPIKHPRSHYGRAPEKVNDLVAFRSSDKGKSWQGPAVAFEIDYNQHGFIPLIPRGGNRIYAFGTQPVWESRNLERGLHENAPIGYRSSDDDGRTWSEVTLIRPEDDPDFTGMSVMRMCETEAGTWLIGSHEGDWSYRPLMTRQYVLRSTDRGASWTVLPGPRHGGWYVRSHNRMDEGRPIDLGGGEVLMMLRTPEGRLWSTRSLDDGVSWEEPGPTPLVHPDAPPMLFKLSDGRTLAAFHHNRFSDRDYTGLGPRPEVMKDRGELWVAFSRDGGRTWSEPRFLLATAAAADLEDAFFNYQCSYMDLFIDEGVVNMFVPHRWQQVLHLQFEEVLLWKLPALWELR
jgi:hypothetical protein